MNPEDIDLTRHGVIAASAGTGKTYTIEQLVLRLLREEQWPLSRFLIVTYTEKAAGELRERLRAAVDKGLAEETDVGRRRFLQAALDDFDQAAISTIHGFCQGMLRDYPLEQGYDFAAEVVADDELFRPALREVQRRGWRDWLGDHLAAALDEAGYVGKDANAWEKKVRDIVKRFQGGEHERLAPALLTDWPTRGLKKEAWPKDLRPAAAHQLAVRTIHAVLAQMRETKLRHGWQSFDDMVRRVADALDPKKNPGAEALLYALRQRYQIGIVDEFQDTNPGQWDIFRRIFLDAGPGKLFVVGDPKQAIYSFQRADLHTYHRAVGTMRNAHGAAIHELPTNWRSSPALLTALNHLFSRGEWFRPARGILYQNVGWPEENEQRHRLEQDASGRAALTVVDWTLLTQWTLAKKRHGAFIAAEIDHLLHGQAGGPTLAITVKNERRPLEPRDIAVLVFTRSEARAVLDGLRQRGIPYSFQKHAGLWKSDEALHLRLILQALVDAHDPIAFRKALLTAFFRCKPEELARCEALPPSHPARVLFARWLAYAERQAWGPLFQSLAEDTGILVAQRDEFDAERRRANLLALLNTLAQAGYERQLDTRGLLDFLRRKCQEPQDDEDWQPVETERSKVQIMTIFASKGLEFPVVFLAGGFTRRGQGLKTYHEADLLVYDLDPSKMAKEIARDEYLDEQRRLLYVALTRAMFKLYVPLVGEDQGRSSAGYAGSAHTLLKPALELAKLETLDAKLAQRIAPPPPRAEPLPRAKVQSVNCTSLPPSESLFPAPAGDIEHRRLVVRSFSSMRREQEQETVVHFGADHERAEDEAVVEPPTDDPWRGAVFGDLVHQVLERIDFAEVGVAAASTELLRDGTPAARLIGQLVDRNVPKLWTRAPRPVLAQSGRRQVADLVWRALHTPLEAVGCPLWEIAPKDRLTELEFLFPQDQTGPGTEQHWTGFMDLVFRRQDKIYLLDWKSNLLPAYGPDDLARSMAESDYHRQYRLYLQALVRWLRSRGQPPRTIGGVYYLYVRGLTGLDESAGVFFHRPTPADIDVNSLTNLTGQAPG